MTSPAIVIVGPTAAGKSAAAVELATRFGGEVVSADSVQVYRGFDIGSAKPTADERQGILHHMIDVADAGQDYTAAAYAHDAAAALREIAARGHAGIVAGGTGLYLRALFEGLIAAPGIDSALRAELGALPTDELRRRLAAVDAEREQAILGEDRFRLIRALEIVALTGRTPSDWAREQRRTAREDVLWIGLTPPRDELYRRIDARAARMWGEPWFDEVRRLNDAGFGATRPMRSVGYAEVYDYLYANADFQASLETVRRRTRQYAKRQLTWFRSNPAVHWFDPLEAGTLDRIAHVVQKWLD